MGCTCYKQCIFPSDFLIINDKKREGLKNNNFNNEKIQQNIKKSLNSTNELNVGGNLTLLKNENDNLIKIINKNKEEFEKEKEEMINKNNKIIEENEKLKKEISQIHLLNENLKNNIKLEQKKYLEFEQNKDKIIEEEIKKKIK